MGPYLLKVVLIPGVYLATTLVSWHFMCNAAPHTGLCSIVRASSAVASGVDVSALSCMPAPPSSLLGRRQALSLMLQVVDYIIASVESPTAFFDAQAIDVEAEFTDNEWVSLNLCEVGPPSLQP